MKKEEILEAIRRMTAENGGKPPGSQRFESETGLRKHQWYPHLWLRWGDAIRDAGLEPNSFNKRFDETHLVRSLIKLVRELGRFPLEGDLLRQRKKDKGFPHPASFMTLGSKAARIRKVVDYCIANKDDELSEVLKICRSLEIFDEEGTEDTVSNEKTGFVYLLQHGNRREYKIGRTYNTLRREGEIGIELPEKGKPIHTIKTDDPAGIERYWHDRFKEKRKNGEWFELSKADVVAFKKWKRIY